MSLTSNGIGEIHHVCGKVSFEWEIPDYFSLSQKTDTYYDSPSFLLLNSNWYIRIYPNGQRCNQSVESLGIYLCRRDPSVDEDVTFILGIKKPDGTVCISRRSRNRFDDWTPSFGWSKFMDRLTLIQLKRKVAPQGILTIFCIASSSLASDVGTQTIAIDSTEGLCNHLHSLLLNGENSDIIFKVKGREFRAHKLILTARSPALGAMISKNENGQKKRALSNSDVISITDCDANIFHDFLHFMYTGMIENLTLDNVIGLQSLAVKYEVKELTERCSDFLNENLTVDTVCDILAMADLQQNEELRKSAKELFIRNIKRILPTEKGKSFMAKNSALAIELLMTVIPEESS